ncbi:unnamed protein product [Heterobilharzia americana]|nr:unnamed protein product [Heterobilharzia americana]
MPSTRNFENRLNHLRSLWESLDHLLGPKKLIFIGAVALRLNSFFNKVTSNLRDWIRIYASYLYESAENFYKTAERILLCTTEIIAVAISTSKLIMFQKIGIHTTE